MMGALRHTFTYSSYLKYYNYICFMEMPKNLISFDLFNISDVDSSVNLFSQPSVNTLSNNSFTSIFFKSNFEFISGAVYNIRGVVSTGAFFQWLSSGVIVTINDLITELNIFASTSNMTFTIEGTNPYYTITFNSSNQNYYILELFRVYNSPVTDSPFINYSVITGSTVSVQTNGVSYPEICNELQQQSYIIESCNVYANSQSQSSEQFNKISKTPMGNVSTDLNVPRLDPMQNQFAIENIDLKFTPSPLNKLEYTIKGGESVRMFFIYNNIIPVPKELNPIIKIETKKIYPMIFLKPISNPLFELTRIKNKKNESIKDVVSNQITLREITDEEVFNSFDGLDFNESL